MRTSQHRAPVVGMGRYHHRGSRRLSGDHGSHVPSSQQYTSAAAFENDYLMGFDRPRQGTLESDTGEFPPGSHHHGLTQEELLARMMNMKLNGALNKWRQFTEAPLIPLLHHHPPISRSRYPRRPTLTLTLVCCAASLLRNPSTSWQSDEKSCSSSSKKRSGAAGVYGG